MALTVAPKSKTMINQWTQYASNPILGGERLGTCFDVTVVHVGPAPWTMYFSWRPRKAIALVRSEDGFAWTQEPEICLDYDSDMATLFYELERRSFTDF